jgi:hypothetical protein
MGKVLALVCVLSGTLRADPCDGVCRPPEEKMDPQLRGELITGAGVVAAGHLIATFALWHLDGVARGLAAFPVIGAIGGVTRCESQPDVCAVLAFSGALQLIGALLTATAWATRNEEAPRPIGLTANGMMLRF